MSLGERLRAKACPQEMVTVADERFQVHGISDRERAELEAKCRDKRRGALDFPRLVSVLLTRCVYDPETGAPVFAKSEEWGEVPSSITGPLKACVLRLNGFDDGDTAGKSPADCD